jgi:hypothetical protein
MPTVAIIGPYSFFFYSSDRIEPLHIHVKHEMRTAKFWLKPVRLEKSKNFNDHELREVQKIVEENKSLFMEKWNEYFNS